MSSSDGFLVALLRQLLGQDEVMAHLHKIERRQDIHMASLTELLDHFSVLQGDVTRVLADLRTIIEQLRAGGLTPEQQALVDQADAAVAQLDASVNAADETPAG